MIDRYFACCDCKIYICAGDRWAYWTLEDAGILKLVKAKRKFEELIESVVERHSSSQ